MVALKGFLVATFFVVSRGIAVPLPGSDLSVTASEARGISDIAIDSLDLRGVTGATTGVRNNKPKSTTPTKKPTKKPAKKPAKRPTKRPTTKPPTKPATMPGKPKSCPPKRPRGLERRYMKPGKDPQKVNEHQFVISKASVTVWNLSGCTAVFFWNYNKTPSAFHILCGESERDDAKKAADLALNADADSYFTIVAASEEKYQIAHAAIEETFTKYKLTIKKKGSTSEDGNGSIVEVRADPYEQKKGQRTRITATKGTTDLVTGFDDQIDCSVQAQ
jgi:hypothetical protein